ncbi:MAG: hypothetical protein ACJ74W_14515 [Pyrinomonadaceae bacterium]
MSKTSGELISGRAAAAKPLMHRVEIPGIVAEVEHAISDSRISYHDHVCLIGR